MNYIIHKRFYPVYRYHALLWMFLVFCFSCGSATRESDKKNKDQNIEQAQQEEQGKWQREAAIMVESQLMARNVKDSKLLKAMKNTPRHRFVPKNMIDYAYSDGPLSIGEGQTISQPYIVAKMTELLKLTGHEKVLEIGTGSGYQAAILSQLTDTCFSIELIKPLADKADKLLKELGYNNVVVKCDDGYKGWEEHAPFDAIIITAAPEVIPEELVGQLKINGRMVVPVGKYFQELVLITKTDSGIKKKTIFPVRFVPMVKPD